MFESAVDENHVFGLIKISPSATDCKVRLYHFVRETTENLSGKKIRKKLSKISYKQRMNMGKYQTGSIRNYQTFQKPITNNY